MEQLAEFPMVFSKITSPYFGSFFQKTLLMVIHWLNCHHPARWKIGDIFCKFDFCAFGVISFVDVLSIKIFCVNILCVDSSCFVCIRFVWWCFVCRHFLCWNFLVSIFCVWWCIVLAHCLAFCMYIVQCTVHWYSWRALLFMYCWVA